MVIGPITAMVEEAEPATQNEHREHRGPCEPCPTFPPAMAPRAAHDRVEQQARCQAAARRVLPCNMPNLRDNTRVPRRTGTGGDVRSRRPTGTPARRPHDEPSQSECRERSRARSQAPGQGLERSPSAQCRRPLLGACGPAAAGRGAGDEAPSFTSIPSRARSASLALRATVPGGC